MARRFDRHREIIYKLVRDERLSPNRRILAEMLMLWMDETDLGIKDRLLKLIEAQFGTPKFIKWEDKEKTTEKVTRDATESLKEWFSEAQESNEVPESEVLNGNE